MGGLDETGYGVRPPVSADAEAYVAYLGRNWARFRGAMPTATPATFDPETYRRRFADPGDDGGEPASVSMLLVAHDSPERILGDATFSNIVYGPFRACHLGFKLDREIEGRGLMRRMLEQGLETMFGRYRLHRIMANYRPENLRSAALLKRLGFVEEGFARAYLHLDGAWRDHVLTALVRPGAP